MNLLTGDSLLALAKSIYYISFKDEYSLGLMEKITWNIFKHMSTSGTPNGNSTLLKKFQVPYLF